MKKVDIIKRLKKGEKIIYAPGLHATVQIGLDTIRIDQFYNLIDDNLIRKLPPPNKSRLEYYVYNAGIR